MAVDLYKKNFKSSSTNWEANSNINAMNRAKFKGRDERQVKRSLIPSNKQTKTREVHGPVEVIGQQKNAAIF